jgi:iron complex transport system ATP-binding protein
MMEVEDIEFKRGRKTILKEVSFSVKHGEMIAIVGPNGAGKSTLLKILSGALKPTSGAIKFHDEDLHKWSPAYLSKNRAVLSQNYQLSMDFTVEEVVLMGRYPFFEKIPSSDDLAIVNEVMSQVQIGRYRTKSINELSGGEQQRVHLARVLAQSYHGRLVFLDEPISSLDLKFQHETLKILNKKKKDNSSIIVVLHDLNLAAKYADRILLLSAGGIESIGEPGEALKQEVLSVIYDIPLRVQDNQGELIIYAS